MGGEHAPHPLRIHDPQQRTPQTYADYERRESGRDYSLERIGRVKSLLNKAPVPTDHVQPEKLSAVWDGPLAFEESPDPNRPYTVLMFVRDLAGKVTVDNPADIGGGETDWWLYREGVRVWMDAVGGGANTLRGSGITWSLFDPAMVEFRLQRLKKPRHPVQVVITGTGNLNTEEEFILTVPEFTTVVLTSRVGKQRLEPKLLVLGRDRKHVVAIGRGERALNFDAGMRMLRSEFDVKRLLIVGGSEIATALLQAKLVDELFLTGSPRLLGGGDRKTFFEGAGFLPESREDAKLLTVKVGERDSGTLFLRYRLT